LEVGIIVNADLSLPVVEAVESTNILGDCAAPGDGKGKKERVQARVVESFANVATCSENDAGLASGDFVEASHGGLDGGFCEAAAEFDDFGPCCCEGFAENFEMVGALRENERRAAFCKAACDILEEESVSRFVVDEGFAEIAKLLPRIRVGFARLADVCQADNNIVHEWALKGLMSGLDAVSHGTALHENDWVVSILAVHGGGKSGDEASLGAACNQLESRGGYVVALVYDEMAIVGDEVGDCAFSNEALDECDVDFSRGFASAAADASEDILRRIQKGFEPRGPLLEELLAVDEDERVDPAGSYQPSSKNGFPKSSSGGENSTIVGKHGLRSDLLIGSEHALELEFQRTALLAFVSDNGRNSEVIEKFKKVVETASREADVGRMVFGTRDDAGLVVRREAHRLGTIEFGILKRGEVEETIAESGRERLLGNID
jgi:hypothetical protein